MFLGLKDKYIEGKIQKIGTSFFTCTLNYGTTKEKNQKVILEQILTKGNANKFHQTEAHSPCSMINGYILTSENTSMEPVFRRH